MAFKFRFLMLLVCMILLARLNAANEVQTKGYALTAGLGLPVLQVNSIINLEDPYWVQEYHNCGINDCFKSYSQRINVTYSRSLNTDHSASNWNLEIIYDVYENGTLQFPADRSLLIGTGGVGQTNGHRTYQAQEVLAFQGKTISIKIKSIQSASLTADELKDVRIDFDLIKDSNRDLLAWTKNDFGYKLAGEEILSYWQYVAGAEMYELQWVYIDGQDVNFFSIDINNVFDHADPLSAAITTDQHYKEPVSVITGEQFYNIYNLFNSGNVFMRVRPIGYHVNTSDGNRRHIKTGNWSEILVYNIPVGFETEHNWQYAVTYAENAKSKKVITYADGSLRGRQSLTILSTDQRTAISDQNYDYEGRASFSTLPVPVAGINLHHFDMFNRINGGGEYTKSDYDIAPTTNGTLVPQLDDQYGAAKYYSSNNSISSINQAYIPDALGYPFTQTIYTRDGTGRVARAGGLGPDFQISSGRETKYFYGNTNETELHRLFGSNVGKASHYKKNLVVDPNGQISVSYLDQEGRTIATALAGVSPQNVIPITNNDQTITASLNDNNVLNKLERKSKSVNKITNAIPNTEYEFNYDFTGVKNSLGEPFNLCLTCSYKLTIFISDPSGQIIPLHDVATNTDVNSIVTDINAGSTYNCESSSFGPVSLNFTAEFESIGQYTVTKILEITSEQLDGYVAQGSIGDNYPDIVDLENIYAEGIDYTLCNFTCEQHYRLPCYLDLSISAETAYEELTSEQKIAVDQCIKSKCDVKTNVAIANVQKSDCESLLGQMKSDIRPEANYHWWKGDDLHHPQNILNDDEDEVVSTLGTISNSDGSVVVYVTDLMNGSLTEFDNHSGVAGAALKVELEDWMLDELVKSHREYCHYEYCIANTLSDEYDVHMMKIQSFEEALATTTNWNDANFLDPLNNGSVTGAYEDPYFTTTPGSSLKSAVATQVYVNYNSTGMSLMDYLAPPAPTGATSAPYLGLPTNSYGGIPAAMQNVYDFQAYLAISAIPEHDFDTWVNVENETAPTDRELLQASEYQGVDWNDINSVNARHWNLWKGKYQDIKLNAMANYEESQGCTFYHDEHKITKDPRNTVTTLDEAMDIVNANTEELTHEACNANMISWRYNIESHCGIIPDNIWFASYYVKLKHYCEAHSGYANPMGQILSTDLTTSSTTSDPDLWQVKTWLEAGYGLPNSASCTFPTTMIVPAGTDPGSSAIITEISPCFKNFVEVVFDALNSTPTAYTYLLSCYGSASLTTSGDFITLVSVPGSGGRCSPYFLFLDEDLNYINYSSLLGAQVVSIIYHADGPPNTGTCVGCTTETSLSNPTNYTGCKVRILLNGEYKDLWVFKGASSSCDGYIEETVIGTPPSVNEDEFNILDTATTRCIRALEAEADYHAAIEWQKEVDSYNNELRATADRCFDNPFNEDFYVSYRLNEYHYTLYYYDQAGNLVQTVPPKGVQPVGSSGFSSHGVWNGTTEPLHLLESKYKFNSLQAVREQTTPDAGLAKFWYDAMGQLKISQNAKQFAESTSGSYSVSVYDELGRVNWVSKMVTTYPLPTFTRDLLGNSFFPFNVNMNPLTYSEVTYTDYNRGAILAPSNFNQRNLRGKVSAAGYFESLSDLVNGNKVFYSYDEHGNVESVQNFIYSNTSPIEKRTDYEYDLISGKVNKVIYQPGGNDMFIHKYFYDADNRITNVFTSHDGRIWEEDAEYFYAPHGPLTRTEIGHDKVQGLDYYYTLQGWLKGVNTPVSTRNDIGNDAGSTGMNKWTAQDGMAFALGYYEGDYIPINPAGVSLGAAAAAATWPTFSAQIKRPTGTLPSGFKHGLFNGNITWMITDLPGLGTDRMQGLVYQYDQLNRLAKSFSQTYSYSPGEWNTRVSDHLFGNYDEAYTYDGNGNIETLKRIDNWGSLIDDFTYTYGAGNNRLVNLYDDVANATCSNCDNGCGNYNSTHIANGNHIYDYDEIGNLTADDKEDIDEIKWNTYGKITDIKYNSCSNRRDLRFLYDATGNRVAKIIGVDQNQDQWEYTYYVRDASGNVMAIYDRKYVTQADGKLGEETRLAENPIYGSARVGNYAPSNIVQLSNIYHDGFDANNMFASLVLTDLAITQPSTYKRVMSLKQYELSNHLGNVLTTITDLKKGVDANADGIVEYYKPDYLSVQDYYPFGMAMDGRKYSPSNYRYGFNGKEKDDEVKGDGVQYDYGFRIYDARIAKFLSVDPLTRSYPYYTPYQFAGNKPIWAIDLDGLEEYYATNGKLIGVGDPRIKTKLMVLDNTTAKELKEQVKANGNIAIGYTNPSIKTIPTPQVVDAFALAYKETEKPSDNNRLPNHHEEALAIGVNRNGETDVAFSPPGKDAYLPVKAQTSYGPAANDLMECGYEVTLVAHTHPWQYYETSTEIFTSSPEASFTIDKPSDVTSVPNDGLGAIDRVVLGYKVDTDINLNSTDQRVTYKQGERQVTYYDGGSKNNGSISFSDLQKLSKIAYEKK